MRCLIISDYYYRFSNNNSKITEYARIFQISYYKMGFSNLDLTDYLVVETVCLGIWTVSLGN